MQDNELSDVSMDEGGIGDTPSRGEFRINFFVHDVSRMRRTLFDQEAKPLGLTRSQWWVLLQLSRVGTSENNRGMLQTELANMLDVGKVTVGGLIDRLEASGFVERRPDATDRRAKRIFVTESGQRVINEMVKIARRLNQGILKGVDSVDLEASERVLARMKENIRAMLV